MSCACAQEPRHAIKLINIQHLGCDTYHLDFVSETLTQWREGDSSKLYIPIGDRTPGKKFSYASLPKEGYIRFTTRLKAKSTQAPSLYKQALFSTPLGSTLEVTAPKGEFSLRRLGRPVVLLSNGVGIAAVCSLVKQYCEVSEGIPELIQLNVDASGAIYSQEFEALSHRHSQFRSYYVDRRMRFYETLSTVMARLKATYSRDPLFYVVGSESFVRQVTGHLEDLGYAEEDFVRDQNGGCGCSLPTIVQLL